MSPKNIIFDVKVGDGAGEWYGTLVVSNIRYEDKSAVTINEYLGVTFKSPFVTAPITANTAISPWQQTTANIAIEPIDDKTVAVTAQIIVGSPHTFQASDSITFGINGNLTVDSDTWTGSFALYADDLPSGTVEVDCAAAPDKALADSEQGVTLFRDSQPTPLSVVLGKVKANKVAAGTYTITADELTNSDETVVATAQVSPSSVSVKVGETTTVKLAYSTVQKYSALDVSIGQLSPPLNKEQLHGKVIDYATGAELRDFHSPSNHLTKLRRLPASGNANVSAQILLNNVQYLAIKPTSLENKLVEVSISQSDIVTAEIDTTGFVTLPIKINTDLKSSSNVISVRLSAAKSDLIYTQEVRLNAASPKFDVPVAPGQYAVQATGFIDNSTAYAVQTDATLAVASNGSSVLNLTTQKGADLEVHGFPNFLSFGALSDLSDLDGKDFIAAKASSLFKYAGNDGAGDAGTDLPDDPATTKTVQLAATVEEAIGGGHTVLPVMISYTVNLSLGDSATQLQNAGGLAHSFGNLILSLNKAKEHGKPDVPAGYVVNPDFLGECQKAFAPDYAMPVRKPLEDALAYRGVDASVPSEVTDTLKGYVLAVNWLFRTVGPGVTFGWQVNLWGVGRSEWIYAKGDAATAAESPAEMARQTAAYIQSLGVYDGAYAPDFLAVDRYEADDFTQRAYVNGYCYGPYEWGRFFDFCGCLSFEMRVPVMPWQIPASRIPDRGAAVKNLEEEHWGSGGTYIFGDAAIGGDYANVHPAILAVKPAALVGHPTVEDLFATAPPFDLGRAAYADFPLRGIFAVLLGGGATTGVMSNIGKTGDWTQQKMDAYIQSPVPFSSES
ncbi:putative hydroxymethyltransferase [Hypoxylon rubiginosum]|uniref:Hydroxymethyltransferase n=1 Tax=Hypoxylon rubiginosum TaxID=110542 RepID=A0ACB9YS47_9PEZI|nr:putative hydroxymethyltransferase [Hypoxylon rubiginosum]